MATPGGGPEPVVSGELKLWHNVTVTFDGPQTSEDAEPNPFRDYRLNVTFTHAESGTSDTVPGYYAADGEAAETSADAGAKWRAHFAPDREGEWGFAASFRQGGNLAMSLEHVLDGIQAQSQSKSYKIVGVERELERDTVFVLQAATPANARAKAELRGVVVTEVELIDDENSEST